MKKKPVLLVIASMILGLLVGCGGEVEETAEEAPSIEEKVQEAEEEPESEEADGKASKAFISVGYAQVGHESDWRTANTRNYQEVFSEVNGYELTFAECDNDSETQMKAVRSFIEKGLDYIIIAPIETAGWDAVLQEAQDAGIPVIITERQIEASTDLYAAWVGTDMENEGVTAGKWLAEKLNGENANILVIEGSAGEFATLGRTEGFKKIAAEHSEWTILDSQSGAFTKDGGQKVMESFIKEYEGQFNVVVCQNEEEAYGAMDAMDEADIKYGVDGDVILITYNATRDGLTHTIDGKINCNVGCNPFQAETVADLIQAMNKDESFEATTFVADEAFVAGKTTSKYAITMTEDVLKARKY